MMLFRNAYCAELADALRSEAGLEAYNADHFELEPEKCIQALINIPSEIPLLDGKNKDALAAIKVYEYLGELSEIEASDKRLWTTLTHITFRQYVKERWPAKFDDNVAKRNAILRRWFAEGDSDRTLENNAIARLWWGAHLTYAPWKSDPDEFGHLMQEDEYYFTRVLFSLQELIKVTLESSLGRSNKVLIALLSYLGKRKELVNNEDVGKLMRELNLIAGANKILVLSCKDIEVLIENTGKVLFPK